MNLRNIVHINLALMLMLLVPTGTLLAIKPASTASRAERTIELIKSIYSFDYLDGANGKYRNASLWQKIVRQPGRVCVTAAVYGLTFLSAKKLYEVAKEKGLLQEFKTQAAQQLYRQKQRERHQKDLAQRKPAAAPDNYHPANNARIANPIPGRQLHIQGIPNLPGFYHMQSNTPYRDVEDSCGVNAAYNMAQVEARVLRREMNDAQFERVRRAVFPQMGNRGAYDAEVVEIAQRFGLAPVIALGFNDTDEIQRVGRPVEVRVMRDRNAQQEAFEEALVDAAYEDVDGAARAFRRAHGPRVAHFLCGIPGHWIAISVTRNALGEQAMYLYDNLNNRPHAVAHMARHVEHIYYRFF